MTYREAIFWAESTVDFFKPEFGEFLFKYRGRFWCLTRAVVLNLFWLAAHFSSENFLRNTELEPYKQNSNYNLY